MNVKIVAEKCQGHGMCSLICPQTFKHDNEGFGLVVPGMADVPDELRDEVNLAAIQCPEQAILLEA